MATAEPSGATMASTVYMRLRSDIIAGRLEPGAKLRLEFLRRRYQAGNSPVREALNRLTADRLVACEDQRGFYVTRIGKSSLVELTKTRCWVEEIALRESIANATVAWEEHLVLSLHRLNKAPRLLADGSSNGEWDRLHRELHMNLITNCGSRWLLGFCEQLFDQAGRYRSLGLSKCLPAVLGAQEHTAIVDAAIARESDRAVALLKAHYEKTPEELLGACAELLDDD